MSIRTSPFDYIARRGTHGLPMKTGAKLGKGAEAPCADTVAPRKGAR
jgi:hypothetical protein